MIEAGRVDLTDHERGFFALTLEDALTPFGMDFDADRAARLIEARLAVLLAARGERGYHEGWAARSGDDLTPEVGYCGKCLVMHKPEPVAGTLCNADGFYYCDEHYPAGLR